MNQGRDFILKNHWIWLIWMGFTLAMVLFADHHRTVSINYWQAAHHWLTQQPLYNGSGKGFIYLPQSAILYVPLSLLPFTWSEALWRLLSISIFTWGLFRLIPLYNPPSSVHRGLWLLTITLLILPLCFDSARNGQMHLLITGLLMSATVNLSRQEWLKATFLIALSFFLKPTGIVFLLLTAGVFPVETALYFLLWGALFLLAPFLTQSWHYVVNQYDACMTMLRTAATTGQPQDWAQLFNLISQAGWEPAQPAQTAIRAIAAVIFLGVGLWVKRGRNLTDTAIWLLMLAMTYLMLFNPRTENNDYMMLSPVITFGIIQSITNKRFYRLGFLILITAGLIGSYYLSSLFVGHRNWGAPFMTILLLIFLSKLLPTRNSQEAKNGNNLPAHS